MSEPTYVYIIIVFVCVVSFTVGAIYGIIVSQRKRKILVDTIIEKMNKFSTIHDLSTDIKRG